MGPDIIAEFLEAQSRALAEASCPSRPTTADTPASPSPAAALLPSTRPPTTNARPPTARANRRWVSARPVSVWEPEAGTVEVVARHGGEQADYMRHVQDAAKARKRAPPPPADGAYSGDGGGGGDGGGDGVPVLTRKISTWHAPDAYAMGIMCWEMMTLRRPYPGMNRHELFCAVQAGTRPYIAPAEAEAAPTGYVALMRELWAQDPVERPTFAETLRRLSVMAEQLSTQTLRQHGRRRRPRDAQPVLMRKKKKKKKKRKKEKKARRRRRSSEEGSP